MQRVRGQRYAPEMKAKEGLHIDGLDALLAAGRRLLEVDPERFTKILGLARTFVAIYDRPEETEDVFESRLAQISSKTTKAVA